MWVTTTISFIAIFLAYISQFNSKGKYFECSFILLTIIASIQYNYGTDYMNYYNLWEQYSKIDAMVYIENMFNIVSWQEPGWILLNIIFGFKYGFFFLVALISIIENYIYYHLIKEYVPIRWRWFAVFFYVCMDCLYLLNFSMMRQGLTVALFVSAVMLLNKKKLWLSIFLILFSLTIHASSAICIPFILLYFLPLKETKSLAVLLLLLTFVIFVFKDVVISGIKLVFSFEEIGKYSSYDQEKLSDIGMGYFISHIPNFVILYTFFSKAIVLSREQKVISLLAFCDLLITPLQFYGASMAGRLGIYFIAFKVASIPIIYCKIKKRNIRFILVYLSIFITLVLYFKFFQEYIGGYQTGYRTIFSVI